MFVYLLDKFTLFSIIGLSVVLGFWIISVFSKDENEKRKIFVKDTFLISSIFIKYKCKY